MAVDFMVLFPLPSVYGESEDGMFVYVFRGSWCVCRQVVSHTSSKQGHDSCSQCFSPCPSYLFLGFVLKYPKPHLSLLALQVFVCFLIGLWGAPPLPKSNWVAKIQTKGRNFRTSVNLCRTLANAGKHSCVCNQTVQYIKRPFVTWGVCFWDMF